MISLFKISVIMAFLTFSNADPIPFKDCGSAPGAATNSTLDILGCSKLPCIFVQDTNATLILSFTAAKPFKMATNKVTGVIAGVKVPFPLPQKDACENGIDCPLTPNKFYSEAIKMPILEEYPCISLYVQFELVNENSESIICAYFPVKIAKQAAEDSKHLSNILTKRLSKLKRHHD